ncbi:unnamed protein product [Meloidogyne enterolobii]|uniref:Uncharacterized protein n=1 Tax=Meloidogyne enterolobii TaxID=390850 RepID=A0ACB0XKE7_MELEN
MFSCEGWESRGCDEGSIISCLGILRVIDCGVASVDVVLVVESEFKILFFIIDVWLLISRG